MSLAATSQLFRGCDAIRTSRALAEGATLTTIPLIRDTGRPVKANLSLDAGVLAAIGSAAARRKLTRSAFIEAMARETIPKMAEGAGERFR